MDNIQNLLEVIIKAITHYPENVKVNKIVDDIGVLFSVRVDGRDMGLVIGKRGENINAVKHLVKIVGYKTKTRVSVRVEEPQNHA